MSLTQWPGQQAYLKWTDSVGSNLLTFDLIISEDWDEGTTVTEHPVEVGANVSDHVRVKLPTCSLKIRSTNEPINDGGPDSDQSTLTPVTLNVASIRLNKTSGAKLSFQDWNNKLLERVLAATAGGVVGGALGGSTGGALGSIGGGLLGSLLFQPEAEDVTVQTDAGLGTAEEHGQSVKSMVFQFPNGPAGKDYVKAYHTLLVRLKNDAQLIDVYGSKQTETSMVIETLSFHRDADTGTGEDVTIGFKKVRIVTTKTVSLPIQHLSGGGGPKLVEHSQQEAADASMRDSPAVNQFKLNSMSGYLIGAPIEGFAPGLGF